MKKNPTYLLSSDWHIRGDTPKCRTDDYMKTQKKKIKFILDLASKHDCPVLIAGDLGNKPTWGDELLNWTINIIAPKLRDNVEIIMVPGQHDLLDHRLDMWDKRGLGVLEKKNLINVLSYQEIHKKKVIDMIECSEQMIYGFPYGIPIRNIDKNTYEVKGRLIALCHTMVIKTQQDKLWPDQKTHSAQWYLKKFPCYDLIVTGDNHQSFIAEYEGRFLINPGSLMRMTANQINHKPSVYLWYAEENKVERVCLPIEKNVIDRSHIEIKEDHEDKMDTYVECLKDNIEIGFSFDDNLDKYIKKNKPKRPILNELKESMK